MHILHERPLFSFLEMAESKACEIGALSSGILHTGYLRKAGEGCELLLGELKL